MHFRAKLRRTSSIHNDWIGASRIGGTINGVKFERSGLHDYVSAEDPLPGDAVSALLNHNMVDLEVTTTPVQSATVTVLAGWHPHPGEQIKTGDDDPPPCVRAPPGAANLESLLAAIPEPDPQEASEASEPSDPIAEQFAQLRRSSKEPTVTRPRGRPPNASRHQ
jgi:hypothetical protein